MSKQVTVYSQDGAEVGKVKLCAEVFGFEPNKANSSPNNIVDLPEPKSPERSKEPVGKSIF